MASNTERELLRVKKLLKEVNDLREQFGEVALKINFDKQSAESLEANFKGLTDYATKYNDALDNANEKAGDLHATIKANLDEMGKMTSSQKQYNQGLNKSYNLSQKIRDDQMGIAELRGKEVSNLFKQAKIELARRGALKEELKNKRDVLRSISDEERVLLDRMTQEHNIQNELVNTARARLEAERKIEKAMGLSGAAVKGITNLLGKIGIPSEHFEGMADDMRESAKSGSKFKVALTGVAGLARGIGKALTDPLVIIGLIVKAVKFLITLFDATQKKIRDVGRAFGVSGDQAQRMKDEIHAAGDGSGDLNYFTEELLSSQMAINKAMGMNLKLNVENAKVAFDLSHFIGLGEEAAGKLYLVSKEMGFSFKDAYDQVSAVTHSLGEQTGFAMKTEDAIQMVSGASANVKYNIKGGLEGLVKAAHTAKRLGVSMEEIASASEAHLDFENSIQNEIKTEMHLQKDLNLEKLRYAASKNDFTTVASETARIVLENKEALKGNAFLQISMRKTLNITQDQLMEILNTENKITNAKDEQVKANQQTLKGDSQLGKNAEQVERQTKSLVKQIKKALEPLAEQIVPGLLSLFAKLTPMIVKVVKFLAGPAGLALIGVAGAFMAVKGAVNIYGKVKDLLTGQLFKKDTYTATGRLRVSGDGGGGGMGMASMLLGKRGLRSGKMFKGLSKKIGGKSTFMGRQLRNLSAMSFKRSSFLNQIVKNSSVLKTIIPSMALLNSKVPGGTGGGSKYAQQLDAKAANSRATASKANSIKRTPYRDPKTGRFATKPIVKVAEKTGLKSTTKTLQVATKTATGFLKKVPLLGPLLDIGMSSYFGSSAASMTAEEQKASGIKENIGTGEAITYELLTGNSSKGSMFTEMLGGEKGSVGDESLGFGTAAAGGAMAGAGIGGAIGALFFGVGAAPGAAIGGAVGAVVGTITEGFKVFSDPNSAMRQSLSSFVDDVGNKFSEAGTAISEWGSSALSSISSFASSSMESLSEWGSSAWNSVSSFASSSMETLGGWVSSSTDKIASFATSSFDTVRSLASSATDIAKDAYSFAAEKANSIGSSISGGVNDAYNATASVVSDGWNATKDFFSFSDGGVVPGGAPYTDRVPSMLTPGERVVTKSGEDEMLKLLKELVTVVRKGGNVYLDGNKVGHALALQSSRMG